MYVEACVLTLVNGGKAGVDHIELREAPCTCTRICMYHSCDVFGAPSLLTVYTIRSYEALIMNSMYYCVSSLNSSTNWQERG